MWMFSLLAQFIFFALVAGDDTCYWPNQEATDSSWESCHGNRDVSWCCKKDDACLGNQLCMDSYGALYRGACTIKTWQRPAICLESCIDVFNNTFAPVYPCPQNQNVSSPSSIDSTNTQWWCGGSMNNFCTDKQQAQLFNIKAGRWQRFAGHEREAKVPVAVPIGVGVGIGVPLLLALAAAGLVLRRERQRRNAAEREANAVKSGMFRGPLFGGGGGGYPGYGIGGGGGGGGTATSTSPLEPRLPEFEEGTVRRRQGERPIELEETRPTAELEDEESRKVAAMQR